MNFDWLVTDFLAGVYIATLLNTVIFYIITKMFMKRVFETNYIELINFLKDAIVAEKGLTPSLYTLYQNHVKRCEPAEMRRRIEELAELSNRKSEPQKVKESLAEPTPESDKPQDGVRMPFGKYQGKLLAEVPKEYLFWIIENNDIKSPRFDCIREELKRLGYEV